MKNIDTILQEIHEDKHENLATTSKKFKRDIWEFFHEIPNFEEMSCVEYGTHKGQTTRVLSYLFDHVYTINLPGNFDKAKELNADRSNITFVPMDLYKTPITSNFKHVPVNVHFIDAGHDFNHVVSDFTRCLEFDRNPDHPIYFIFDDYGHMIRSVGDAVNQLISIGSIEIVKRIGHSAGHSFGGNPERILVDSEGVICVLK